jgi:hypothetical protein
MPDHLEEARQRFQGATLALDARNHDGALRSLVACVSYLLANAEAREAAREAKDGAELATQWAREVIENESTSLSGEVDIARSVLTLNEQHERAFDSTKVTFTAAEAEREAVLNLLHRRYREEERGKGHAEDSRAQLRATVVCQVLSNLAVEIEAGKHVKSTSLNSKADNGHGRCPICESLAAFSTVENKGSCNNEKCKLFRIWMDLDAWDSLPRLPSGSDDAATRFPCRNPMHRADCRCSIPSEEDDVSSCDVCDAYPATFVAEVNQWFCPECLQEQLEKACL